MGARRVVFLQRIVRYWYVLNCMELFFLYLFVLTGWLLLGVQTRNVPCRDTVANTVVADAWCAINTKPDVQQVRLDLSRCSTSQSFSSFRLSPDFVVQPCSVTCGMSYSWFASAWSTCSVQCNGGTQTRTVTCRGTDNVDYADSFCTTAKVSTSQACNTVACGTFPSAAELLSSLVVPFTCHEFRVSMLNIVVCASFVTRCGNWCHSGHHSGRQRLRHSLVDSARGFRSIRVFLPHLLPSRLKYLHARERVAHRCLCNGFRSRHIGRDSVTDDWQHVLLPSLRRVHSRSHLLCRRYVRQSTADGTAR